MKHLLNTLFVTSEDVYLSLDGENVVANRDRQEIARYPLHTLSGIISFSYPGASPALMGACAKRDISLAFCTPRGRFLARVSGESSGNVLLRRTQYRIADNPEQSCRIARNMILDHGTAMANLLGVLSIGLIFVIRKFFFVPSFGATLPGGEMADDVKAVFGSKKPIKAGESKDAPANAKPDAPSPETAQSQPATEESHSV